MKNLFTKLFTPAKTTFEIAQEASFKKSLELFTFTEGQIQSAASKGHMFIELEYDLEHAEEVMLQLMERLKESGYKVGYTYSWRITINWKTK